MAKKDDFLNHVVKGHTYKKDSFILGGAMLDGEVVPGAQVKIPLKTLNRHGLIAGATGTGKTKTLQVIAEQLSMKGIPSLLMDLKGDLSGLAQPGASNDHIVWRHGQIGTEYNAEPMPVELLSLSQEKGVKLRATVSEFGPVLFSKIIGLNNTQEGVMSIIFQYCDDNNYPLVDLKDVREVMKFMSGEGKAEIAENYGYISPASIGAISRKVLQIEQQGADLFFGERSFDPQDLLRTKDGKGMV
ncbi:MAG: helicase HerA-like domain-containing protein, partial [Flavobacteriales bacterium]